MRSIRNGFVVCVGLAIVAGLAGGGAEAAKRKRLSARINGKGFKSTPKLALGSTNGLGGFEITGTKATASRHGGSLRQLTIGCEVKGLSASMTFPTTATCAGAYIDSKLGVGSTRGWTSDQGLTVVIQSYDGVHLTGTFGGTLENVGETNPPGDGPATVEKGKFAVDLLGG